MHTNVLKWHEHDSLSQYILIHNPCCPQDSKILCKQACDDDIHMFVPFVVSYITAARSARRDPTKIQLVPWNASYRIISHLLGIPSPISTILPWYTVVAWTNNYSHLIPSYPCYILVKWLLRIIWLLVNFDFIPPLYPHEKVTTSMISPYFLDFSCQKITSFNPSTKTAVVHARITSKAAIPETLSHEPPRLVIHGHPWSSAGWWLTYPSEKYEFVKYKSMV